MAALALEFASGALATSSVTLGSHPEISRLRFCFDGLTAESGLAPYNPGHEPWRFMHDDAAGQERIDRALDDFAPLPERFVGLFLRLHNALAGDAPLPVTIDDAARSIELLSAAYYSVLTGAAVELPIPPAHPFYGGWAAAMRQDLGDG
jgi:predicted dehydrogenase